VVLINEKRGTIVTGPVSEKYRPLLEQLGVSITLEVRHEAD